MVFTLRLYWIQGFTNGHLAIMPAPQPQDLERAVLHWKEEGVDVVVSLLEQAEIPGHVEDERGLCDEVGLEFMWFPIRDGSVPPSKPAFKTLIANLADAVEVGKSVAIHCRAGIGRSGLVAACVLNRLNIDAGVAMDLIAESRTIEVPQTEEQRQWVLGFSADQPSS